MSFLGLRRFFLRNSSSANSQTTKTNFNHRSKFEFAPFSISGSNLRQTCGNEDKLPYSCFFVFPSFPTWFLEEKLSLIRKFTFIKRLFRSDYRLKMSSLKSVENSSPYTGSPLEFCPHCYNVGRGYVSFIPVMMSHDEVIWLCRNWKIVSKTDFRTN